MSTFFQEAVSAQLGQQCDRLKISDCDLRINKNSVSEMCLSSGNQNDSWALLKRSGLDKLIICLVQENKLDDLFEALPSALPP